MNWSGIGVFIAAAAATLIGGIAITAYVSFRFVCSDVVNYPSNFFASTGVESSILNLKSPGDFKYSKEIVVSLYSTPPLELLVTPQPIGLLLDSKYPQGEKECEKINRMSQTHLSCEGGGFVSLQPATLNATLNAVNMAFKVAQV